MRVSEAFPSEYLRGVDLRGNNVSVVIERVEMRQIGDDHKPVLFFDGKEKGVVLNKTNANMIASLYGDDTDDWTGKPVVLFPAMVDFQGKTVEAIRIRGPLARDRKSATPDKISTASSRQSENPADDIPF